MVGSAGCQPPHRILVGVPLPRRIFVAAVLCSQGASASIRYSWGVSGVVAPGFVVRSVCQTPMLEIEGVVVLRDKVLDRLARNIHC